MLDAAARVGCKSVQFIGGEPAPGSVAAPTDRWPIGFTQVEVLRNATRISDNLLQCFVEHQVQVALSLYGADTTGAA